jgi:hypothetical protein
MFLRFPNTIWRRWIMRFLPDGRSIRVCLCVYPSHVMCIPSCAHASGPLKCPCAVMKHKTLCYRSEGSGIPTLLKLLNKLWAHFSKFNMLVFLIPACHVFLAGGGVCFQSQNPNKKPWAMMQNV